MNLEKKKSAEEEIVELKELVKELHGSIHQLQAEVQQLMHERPVVQMKKGIEWTPTMIGQVGGLILGALAIIGIFW
ncbi:hypothetical protein [Bacillus cereus group sp. BfR-BA-01380]|uniref:hypothetical protein n=1 Tax=Bacillus cereus group sp. BfR-BA-01380 TaxID=2920324 RepID=UPI001F55EF43|nr:hypothetical protein [Bacillus cereus group sp. BfR-BA-01380]